MAITTDADFVIDVAPELEGTKTSRMDRFIEVAKGSVSESVWGSGAEKADYATALLTAHILTVLNRKGIGGEVRRKKVGDTEVEYSTVTGGRADSAEAQHELNQTSYGREFLRRRRQLVITPRVAGGCDY